MRRWNGWGEEDIGYPLAPAASSLLQQALGRGSAVPDAQLADVLARIPASRLPDHPLIQTAPEVRLRHARGQSLPDWVALRAGAIASYPDGVAIPCEEAQVRELLDFASRNRFQLIPYGGGTSVVGHINPLGGDAPVLTLALGKLDRLLALDEASRLATLQAGVAGPRLEAQLGQRGFTLGHYPQSWEYSTLGGWIATRSCGQQSLHYGRIEQLFAGARVALPSGSVELPPHPASAAGPDLRQLLLGSEGRLGVITQAVVRVRPSPAFERFYAAFLPDWEAVLMTAQSIAQAELGLSMLRASDLHETAATLALAGRGRLVRLGDRLLPLLRIGSGRCLLIYAVTGERRRCLEAKRAAGAILRRNGGLPLGSGIGELWRADRFRSPYLRNTLWQSGYALDTLESAFAWSRLPAAAQAIGGALNAALASQGERALVFTHLSHLYPDGASLYFTFLYRRTEDPQETLARWQALKGAASRAILEHGGTISHQHGVGLDHAAYMQTEKGDLGLELLRAAAQAFDPQGIMNPGKLLL